MKRLNKIDATLAILALILFSYVLSYVVIRRNNTFQEERDGCPPEGCTVVLFSRGNVGLYYNALIRIDKRLNHVEFRFGDGGASWFSF